MLRRGALGAPLLLLLIPAGAAAVASTTARSAKIKM